MFLFNICFEELKKFLGYDVGFTFLTEGNFSFLVLTSVTVVLHNVLPLGPWRMEDLFLAGVYTIQVQVPEKSLDNNNVDPF